MINKQMLYIHTWLLASFIYWTNAAPFGQALVLLITSFLIFTSNQPFRKVSSTLPILAITTLSFTIGISLAPNLSITPLLTTVHFFCLIFFASFSNANLLEHQRHFLTFINSFILVNLFFLSSNTALGLWPWIFMEDTRGAIRYSFLFSEPSFMGLYTAVLIYLISLSKMAAKIKICYHFILFFLVALTQSASGLILSLVAVSFVNFDNSRKINTIAKHTITATILLTFLILVFTNDFILKRIDLLFSDSDTAFFIRFIAPWMALYNISISHPFTGTGFGQLGEYILRDYSNFWFLEKISESGDILENTNIDNILVYVLSSYGLPLSALLLMLFANVALKSGGAKHLLFITTLCFFTGSFIGPLFISLAFIKTKLPQKESHSKSI